MITLKRKFGNRGEEIAVKYLKKQGYKILDKHFQKKIGEIDIIAYDKKSKILVFCEVKTRLSSKFGLPQEAVNFFKKRRLIKTAWWYLLEKKIENQSWRIDVIAIQINPQNNTHQIKHFKNALQE